MTGIMEAIDFAQEHFIKVENPFREWKNFYRELI